MKRIYVAGKISGKDQIEFLNNVREGISWCSRLIALGYSPYCPFFDWQYLMVHGDMVEQQLKDVSIKWLEVSDGMFILPGWEHSKGVEKEIEVAKLLHIPVFYSLNELNSFYAVKHIKDALDMLL